MGLEREGGKESCIKHTLIHTQLCTGSRPPGPCIGLSGSTSKTSSYTYCTGIETG